MEHTCTYIHRSPCVLKLGLSFLHNNIDLPCNISFKHLLYLCILQISVNWDAISCPVLTLQAWGFYNFIHCDRIL
jgi:hypothetical protein